MGSSITPLPGARDTVSPSHGSARDTASLFTTTWHEGLHDEGLDSGLDGGHDGGHDDSLYDSHVGGHNGGNVDGFDDGHDDGHDDGDDHDDGVDDGDDDTTWPSLKTSRVSGKQEVRPARTARGREALVPWSTDSLMCIPILRVSAFVKVTSTKSLMFSLITGLLNLISKHVLLNRYWWRGKHLK